MLTQVQLRNFKSYQSGTLHLARLTVLIGANASGKSNVIEALRLLAKIAEGEKLGSIGDLYKQEESVLRGGVENLGYQKSRSFGLSCVTTETEWKDLSIELTLDKDGDLRVAKEKITSQNSTVPLYEITSAPQGAGSDVFVTYNNFARGGKKPSTVCSSHMAVFTQLRSDIRFRAENKKSREIIPKVADR